jgi:hypothetical protein
MKQPELPKRESIAKYILLFLVLLIAAIKISSLNSVFIEKYFSTGIYPYISRFFRIVFGWIPFSIGDILYAVAGVYLLVKLVKLVRVLFKRPWKRKVAKARAVKLVFILVIVYLMFNIYWGLNYNRKGIGYQLHLDTATYTKQDLTMITGLLIEKVNTTRRSLDSVIEYPHYQEIFKQSVTAYKQAEVEYPFLEYDHKSIKKSLYGRLGNWVGFLGYYNPFTGESQLNLTQPRFLVPFVTCHEMAHQIGYASEKQANFVGYLAAVKSPNVLFHYSAYFDLFNYANSELYIRDSAQARKNYKALDTLVKIDHRELREFLRINENPVEPIMKMFYDQYLRANQQAKGYHSYNEVVALLIAYHKKYKKI